MATEDKQGINLVTTRTPVGPSDESKSKTAGNQAVIDGVIIIAISWAIIFALAYSLRAHNI